MTRPSVDVVVPFGGGPAELEVLARSISALELGPGDSLRIVDNTPVGARTAAPRPREVEVVPASAVPSPGYARNRGAALGEAEWLVFFDADTVPCRDLLDRYFDPPPAERTALIGGGIRDEAVPADGPAVPRYAYIRGLMGQENTFRFGRWAFPQTANVATRRAAFGEVQGFREDIRAGEDADLTFRLRARGWEVERREEAYVVHRSRQNLRALVAQKLGHGAGGAWLAREHPGSFPARRRPGLVWWGVRTATAGLVAAARDRDRDRALWALLEPVEQLSYEFGRSLRNGPRARS